MNVNAVRFRPCNSVTIPSHSFSLYRSFRFIRSGQIASFLPSPRRRQFSSLQLSVVVAQHPSSDRPMALRPPLAGSRPTAFRGASPRWRREGGGGGGDERSAFSSPCARGVRARSKMLYVKAGQGSLASALSLKISAAAAYFPCVSREIYTSV